MELFSCGQNLGIDLYGIDGTHAMFEGIGNIRSRTRADNESAFVALFWMKLGKSLVREKVKSFFGSDGLHGLVTDAVGGKMITFGGGFHFPNFDALVGRPPSEVLRR